MKSSSPGTSSNDPQLGQKRSEPILSVILEQHAASVFEKQSYERNADFDDLPGMTDIVELNAVMVLWHEERRSRWFRLGKMMEAAAGRWKRKKVECEPRDSECRRVRPSCFSCLEASLRCFFTARKNFALDEVEQQEEEKKSRVELLSKYGSRSRTDCTLCSFATTPPIPFISPSDSILETSRTHLKQRF